MIILNKHFKVDITILGRSENDKGNIKELKYKICKLNETKTINTLTVFRNL